MFQPVITNPPVFVSDYFQFQSDILFLQMQWIIHLGNPEKININYHFVSLYFVACLKLHAYWYRKS